MAINFPDSPTNGQVATIGGKNYTYNSTKNTWTPTQVTEADLSTVGSTTVVATHDLLPASPSAGDMALVSSVNKMYVYFLSGWWLMSSLQNASPSGITGNAAIYDLAADGTPTTVTLSSSDPEGFPISWSHSVISGSLGGTTVTNVDNVFTITPSTDAADAGTFTLRFAATDGQGGESGSQSNFTLDFVFIVANSRYTTLLATAVDTSDNNNITDASTNNHSITVNGDAHAGTFSPYRSGGYSTYFDGAGDYLNAPASATFEFGTGDFSMELFFYRTVGGSVDTLIQYGNASVTGYQQISWTLYISSSNYLSFEISDGTPGGAGKLLLVSSVLFPTNSWVHISVVRDGNDFTLYQNGNSVATITDNRSVYVSPTPLLWIARNHNAGDGDTAGFFSNVRIIKGTAVYTSNFTLPSEPLTAITGTSLLTCHLPYIADGSSNDHSITVNGNTYTKPFSPYDYNEYAAADHGGSVYFDGTGDRITASTSNNFAIGSSEDFIIEAWIYPTNTSQGNFHLFGIHQATYTGGIYLDYHSSDFRIGDYGGGWDVRTTSTVPLIYNTWQHICASRTGNLIKIFFNGESLALSSQGEAHTNSYNAGAIAIGGSGVGADFQGFISDIRFEKGTSRTSNFTPPTAPLSSSGAELHIKGTDASIVDKSQGSNLKLFGNTTGSTTQAKFANTKSMYFDGTGDYAQLPVGSLHLGSSDFTIETWIYQDTNAGSGGSSHVIYSDWINTNNDKSILLRITDSSGQKVQLLYSTDGTTNIIYTSTSGISNSTWTHVAVCKDSTSLRLYIDGVEEIWENNPTFTLNPNAGTIGPLIGGNYDEALTSYGQFFDGYIQDFRISKGLARYTTNFTPPTGPLEG